MTMIPTPGNSENVPAQGKRADSHCPHIQTSTFINRSPLQYLDTRVLKFATGKRTLTDMGMPREPVHFDMHVAMEHYPPDLQRPLILARELTDEQVQEQGPAVRGQLIQRLERIWEVVSGEIERGELEAHQDPRFLELGLRTLDRIAKLYRLLDAPKGQVEEPEDEGAVVLRNRQQVEQQLRELELKVKVAGAS